ncbi:MAG: carboxypeptidase regulatory-like domain-containing protein [Leptolyngbyaceae cyanobacterium]
MHKSLWGCLLGLTAAFSSASVAWGHASQTDYFVDLFSANLVLTASYSSGEPMVEAEVLVYAPDDTATPWSETVTDDSGQFVFVPDESLAGEWRIEITQAGHQDILFIPVNETGIDYLNISQGPKQDLHYAVINPTHLGVVAALGLGGLVVSLRERKHTDK